MLTNSKHFRAPVPVINCRQIARPARRESSDLSQPYLRPLAPRPAGQICFGIGAHFQGEHAGASFRSISVHSLRPFRAKFNLFPFVSLHKGDICPFFLIMLVRGPGSAGVLTKAREKPSTSSHPLFSHPHPLALLIRRIIRPRIIGSVRHRSLFLCPCPDRLGQRWSRVNMQLWSDRGICTASTCRP